MEQKAKALELLQQVDGVTTIKMPRKEAQPIVAMIERYARYYNEEAGFFSVKAFYNDITQEMVLKFSQHLMNEGTFLQANKEVLAEVLSQLTEPLVFGYSQKLFSFLRQHCYTYYPGKFSVKYDTQYQTIILALKGTNAVSTKGKIELAMNRSESEIRFDAAHVDLGYIRVVTSNLCKKYGVRYRVLTEGGYVLIRQHEIPATQTKDDDDDFM